MDTVYYRHSPDKCPTATNCQGHTERADETTLAVLAALRRLGMVAYMADVPPRRPWWRRLLGR